MRINVFLRSNCFLHFVFFSAASFCWNSIQFSKLCFNNFFQIFYFFSLFRFFTSSAYSLTILYQSFSIIFFLLRLYIHKILYFSFFFHLFIFWTVWCQETFLCFVCVCVFVCIQDILWDEKKIINISLTNCNIIKNYYLWIHECTQIHTQI